MHHDSRSAQPPPPTNQSASSLSRWLVVAVAFCGALAGGSIVEVIAALASSTSISFSPDHLIAGPLVLAGALSGGLLAALLASRDQSAGHRPGKIVANSFAPADIIPSEPVLWQPVPSMLPITRTSASTNIPPARSKRRVVRIHRRVHQVMHQYHPSRLAVSRSSTMMDRPRHRGIIHHARLSEKETDAG